MSGLDETQMRKALEGTDASWDTLPLTRNNKDNRNGAGHDRSQNSGNMLVFPRQVFHGLAVMLVVSLGLLLIELRSPGIAQRTVRSLYGRHQQASVAVNNKKSRVCPLPSRISFISRCAVQVLFVWVGGRCVGVTPCVHSHEL